MNRLPFNVWLLTLILALGMSAGAVMVMLGGIIGAQLAPSAKFSTLPIAMMIIGTASGVVPVTRLMGHFGRKKVFVAAALLATTGFLLAALSVHWAHFYGFIGSAFVIGLAIAAFQQIRFAAMESVDVELKAKAASRVLLGGLVAAVLGPELVTWGRNLLSTEYAGAFVLMSLLTLICAILFTQLRAMPQFVASGQDDEQDPSIDSVLRNPIFIIAVSASVVGFALMSFIMTATPVHMHTHDHHSLEHTKWVIQSHILAMYLPSLFSGWLIGKLGPQRIIVLGLFTYVCTMAIGLAGNQLANYWIALILLGLGWNFLFLAGTVLLSQTYTPRQAYKVQGINEGCVFGAQAAASLGAGTLLHLTGWDGLMYISLTIVVLHVALVIYQRSKLREFNQQGTES